MNTTRKRLTIVILLCAATAMAIGILHRLGFVPLAEAEFYTQDWRTRLGSKTAVDPRLVLIGIDRASYADDLDPAEVRVAPVLGLLEQNFPWSRAVWATLIDKLARAGARVIIVDLIFSAPGRDDDALRQMLDKYRDRVVIGCNFSDLETGRGVFLKLNAPAPSVLSTNGLASAALDDRVGYVNIWPDWDGVLRRATYQQTGAQAGGLLDASKTLESLSGRALQKLGMGSRLPPEFAPQLFRYTAPPGLGYKPHPIGDVLSPKVWVRNYGNGAFFRDKIVLIGPTANLFQDTHRTPFTFPAAEMLGPEIHLNILNAALHKQFLRELPMALDLTLIAAMGLLAGLLCYLFLQPVQRLLIVLASAAAFAALAQLLYNAPGLVLPVAGPLTVLLLSSLMVLMYDFVLERVDKTRVRRTLERYVSKNVVKELLDNPQTYFNSLSGVRRNVTVLFSDVRGFTTLTEGADSALLVKQLNEYFSAMVGHVFAHQGTLDKFIGDAVMAVWGNIVSAGAAQDAQHAVATALAMKRSLIELNTGWRARGMTELAFGIGINHGEAIVGNLGSSEKMELTVIGDAVNLASRLEGLTKEYHLDLLIGETLAPLVEARFLLRTVDYVQVKGKTRPVTVYTVLGERDDAALLQSTPWLPDYEAGLRSYRQRDFATALRHFQNCLQIVPDDALCLIYQRRCAALLADPPDDQWNGVYVMTKK